MRVDENNDGERHFMLLFDIDDSEPLPVDGMEVEEFRDADTVRLFMLEWRRRELNADADQAGPARLTPWSGGSMRA